MVLFSVLYKIESKNSKYVFSILAQILGLIAALCSCIVWIPQIKLLLKTQKQGQLSLLMFILQTPGNTFLNVSYLHASRTINTSQSLLSSLECLMRLVKPVHPQH